MHTALLTWVAWVINSACYTGATGYILEDPRMYGGDPSFLISTGEKIRW